MHQKWLILSAVACGTFMATLDSSIVNIALPSITASFHTGLSTSRWVVISYLFSITGLLLFFGKLSDVVGRKFIFNMGYVIFTLGSIACGLSRNITELIFFRGMQGLGSAMLMANGPAIITTAFPANERGKALGILAMVVSAGLGFGPTFGGVLVRLFTWPSIFFVNIPFGIIGAILAYRFIPASISLYHEESTLPSDEKLTAQDVFAREKLLPWTVRIQLIFNRLKTFDWLGAILWLVIQVGYSLAIDRENTFELTESMHRLLTFGTTSILGLFILWEWGIKDPILDLSLFKSKIFLFSNISSFLNFIAISSISLLLPFYFQNVRRMEPQQVGLYMTMIPVTIFFAAPIAGRLSDKYGSRLLSSLGMSLICLSMFLIALMPNALSSSSPKGMLIYLAMIGIGVGLFQSPNNNAIMGAVYKNQLGVASALLATVRNFGFVTGIAISTTLLMNFYNAQTIANGAYATPSENFVISLKLTFVILTFVCASGIFTSLIKEKRGHAA